MFSPQSFHMINDLNAFKAKGTAIYRKLTLAHLGPEPTLTLSQRSLRYFNHSHHG